MDALDYVTGALIALATFDWIAFGILFLAARGQHIKSLDSRARVALLIAASSTLAALLGLNRHFGIFPDGTPWIVLVIAVMLPSLGNLWFVFDLWRGKYRA